MGFEVLTMEKQYRRIMELAIKELSRRIPDIPAPENTHDIDAVKEYLERIERL